MWITLVVSIVLFTFSALHIRIDENISSFFPSQNGQTDFVMKNMKAMDKIVIVVAPQVDTADVFSALTIYADSLSQCLPQGTNIQYAYDADSETELPNYVYSHLPLLLTEADYSQFDSLTTYEAIAANMKNNKRILTSPIGIGMRDIISNDPIGFSYNALQKLQTLRPDNTIEMGDDGNMMIDDKAIMFVTLPDDFSDTGDNAIAAQNIREQAQKIGNTLGVNIFAYGAPLVAVSNSSCVKNDETTTVSIAIILTTIIIYLVFRRKRAIFLVIIPVIYGAIFAFAITAALGVELSLISVGTGAMVLGLAMSYSIHMLTHSLHSDNIEALVVEMTYPMTVGSITTIGAFVGLMFTNSKILQDLGIFASLALLGTLLFCLIFMPHFLTADHHQQHSRIMHLIERVASYDYARNRWLVISIAALTIVGLFFFTNVKFNTDMNDLNYTGDKWLEQSKNTIEQLLTPDDTLHHANIVVIGSDINELALNGERLMNVASTISGINNITSLSPWFLQSDSTMNAKMQQWNNYWTDEKVMEVSNAVKHAATEYGFKAEAFDGFFSIINNHELPSPEDKPALFAEYISEVNGTLMLYVSLTMDNECKDQIMDTLSQCDGVVVTDMGYFVRKATASIVDNFNFILALSSLLVGLVLLLSYRRVELFIMTFLPMCISWVIILGLMAIFNIEFNVVNIILSTFIFGVGDDFSIFIMDGLLSRYKGEKDMLISHKMAIALSGIAIIIGLGVQVFAQHPACKSIGYLSIFGLVAVILTSYVVQPILFHTFISKPAQIGQPYTLRIIFRCISLYSIFVIGCILGYISLVLLFIAPCPQKSKKKLAHYVIYMFMHAYYWVVIARFSVKNIGRVDLSKPCVIVANHQSFIDIIYVLSLSPKIVCITKSWVSDSPMFGPLTRFCDFYNADAGSAEMIEKMRNCLADGYSIVVFPEGTRSDDGNIQRFHKGAFLLAQTLGVDILPIVMYGNNLIASKKQPFNVKNGRIVNKILPHISNEQIVEIGYTAMSKHVCNLMRHEYELLLQEYDAENPYHREVLQLSRVYKE